MSGIDRLFAGMQAPASGMAAERVRMNIISRNIANASTTSTSGGGPYRRQMVQFEPLLLRNLGGSLENVGVRVSRIVEDLETPMERVLLPGHPDADEEGMVTMPNVNTMRELADLITAMRAYEANMSVQDSFMRMAERALQSLRG